MITPILGKSILKIYDEHENEVDMDTLDSSMDVMTILEVQGIKCSARSFQIEFELKQMMVLQSSNLFTKCVIKHSIPSIALVETPLTELTDIDMPEELDSPPHPQQQQSTESVPHVSTIVLPTIEQEDSTGLVEMEVNLDDIIETNEVQIKPRADIYYDMYYTAKRKAKIARELALAAYLEVKRIKNKYMIHDMSESDDEVEFKSSEVEV
jgi:hypothetical protein